MYALNEYKHGHINIIVLCLFSDTVRSQIAFVTFKDAQGAETAILLSVRLSPPPDRFVSTIFRASSFIEQILESMPFIY